MQGSTASAASSVRRKGGNGLGSIDGHQPPTAANHRHSLAFELAAAMEPQEHDQADILDQLGLGDEEDGQDDEPGQAFDPDLLDGAHYGISDDAQDELLSLPSDMDEPVRFPRNDTPQSTVLNSSQKARIDGHSSSPAKSARTDLRLTTPSQRLKKTSRSTIHTLDFHSPQAGAQSLRLADQVAQGEHASAFVRLGGDMEEVVLDGDVRLGPPGLLETWPSPDREADHHQQASQVLEAGLMSTAQFLAVLRQSNTDLVPSFSGPPSSASVNTIHPGSNPDRQPLVEGLISDLVRTMAEHVRDREAQIRELKEIDVALSRTDRRILAELDELPSIVEERSDQECSLWCPSDPDESGDRTIALEEELDEHLLGDEEEELAESDESGVSTPMATSIRNMKYSSPNSASLDPPRPSKNDIPLPHKSLCRPRTALGGLSRLKRETKGLIDSLTQINEHTQISRQTQTDVARKLKGVKGLVSNWKSENESIENSKQFVSQWENLHALTQEGPNQKSVKGLFQLDIELAVRETQQLLDDAFLKASTLLQPRPNDL